MIKIKKKRFKIKLTPSPNGFLNIIVFKLNLVEKPGNKKKKKKSIFNFLC